MPVYPQNLHSTICIPPHTHTAVATPLLPATVFALTLRAACPTCYATDSSLTTPRQELFWHNSRGPRLGPGAAHACCCSLLLLHCCRPATLHMPCPPHPLLCCPVWAGRDDTFPNRTTLTTA